MKRTIPQLFQQSVQQYGSNTLLWEKDDKSYQPATYAEVAQQVESLSLALLEAGIKKGDRITLLSEGRNDWVVTELAFFHIGAISVPLSIKIIEQAELEFKINHSGSRMIFVSENQLSKVRQVSSRLEQIEKIVIFDPVETMDDKEVLLSDFLERKAVKSYDFATTWKSVEEQDCATISYTSGTTSEPKGIMLSHRNYTANVEMAEAMFSIPEWFKTLLILPWDHSFAHTVGIFPMMKNGASLASVKAGKTGNETLKNIPVNIRETQPIFLLTVPALSKNFRKNIEKNIDQIGGIAKTLFKWGVANGIKYHGSGTNRGQGLNAFRKPLVWLFDAILFKKVRQGFGGKIQFMVGGGALLDIELQKFFSAIGMPVYQGYGLTEASPVISSNTPAEHKFGSSGKVAPGISCKILDENQVEVPPGKTGEIVIKGENVMMGYWKNEKATGESLQNGWLHTGDLGYLDDDGFLYVTGRFKSLLIGEDGEKYSPEAIEEALVDSSGLIDQSILYNDHKPFTVALLVPVAEKLKLQVHELNINCETDEGCKQVIDLFREEIRKYHKGGPMAEIFPERWLPSTFRILTEGFTEENRLMNSTMKIVRPKIEEKYKEDIEDMYTTKGKDIYCLENINSIQKILGIQKQAD